MENSVSGSLTIATMLIFATLLMITPAIESFHSDAMAAALSSSGFTLFAHALHAHNLTAAAAAAAKRRFTYLVPPDTSLTNHALNATTVQAHVSDAGALLYKSLLLISPNTTFPTLQNTTLVFSTDGERVSFNDVLVVVPNLYVDEFNVVHGVDAPLVEIFPPLTSPSPCLPRIKTRPSRVSPRRRAKGVYRDFARFIRRSNHPELVDENGKSSTP